MPVVRAVRVTHVRSAVNTMAAGARTETVARVSPVVTVAARVAPRVTVTGPCVVTVTGPFVGTGIVRSVVMVSVPFVVRVTVRAS